MEKGTIELIIQDELSFTLTKSCQGKLYLCYEAESKLISNNQEEHDNLDYKCPPNNCVLNLDLQALAESTMITSKQQQGNVILNLKRNLFVCPMKASKNRQSITVLELPNCGVIVNDAVLLTDDSKIKDIEGELTSTENSVSEHPNNHQSNWFFVAIVCIVGCLFTIVGSTFLGYMQHRDVNNKNAPKPSQRRHSIQDASPTASQSSPTVSEKDEKCI
uniref:ZP domain-containing protein n=1 Tax=Panagrellus redivivus TaxID=6233 RepID=A0A7E4UX83_PANRE